MKKRLLLSTFSFILIQFSYAQEYATFSLTGLHKGTGTFTNATLSNFNWLVSGSLAKEVEILTNETIDDGNKFENNFGQADSEDNLRIKLDTNGAGTAGQPISAKARFIIDFDQITPAQQWGFCIVDIEVENCLISAIDKNDNEVSAQDINKWLIELFDANLTKDSINIPKWDSLNAALLGSSTPANYKSYDSLVIGGMPDSEAASAFFMPDIPLKSLTIDYENLQQSNNTSFHFYIASFVPTSIDENEAVNFTFYPNPANNTVTIQLSNSQTQWKSSKNIIIYNVFGEVVSQEEIIQDNLTLDVSHFAKGMYYMKVVVAEKSIIKKLIID